MNGLKFEIIITLLYHDSNGQDGLIVQVCEFSNIQISLFLSLKPNIQRENMACDDEIFMFSNFNTKLNKLNELN